MEIINVIYSYALYAFLYIGESFIAMSKVYPILTFVTLFTLIFIIIEIPSTGNKKSLKEALDIKAQLKYPPIWIDKTANCLAYILASPIMVMIFFIIKFIHIYNYFCIKFLQKKLGKRLK